MVWPLTLRRTVILKKIVHVPTKKVLALLQYHNVLLATNPIVINVTPDSLKPSNTWYTVTGVISFAGLFNFQTKYRCQLDLVQDGLDMEIFAAAGTRAKGRYRAKSIEAEVTELNGEVVIESIFFMLPYVLSTFAAAHASGLEMCATKAENRTNMAKHTTLGLKSSDSSSARMFSVTLLMAAICCLYYAYSIRLMSLVIVGTLSLLYWSTTARDPYGLFHLSLNKLPGEDTDSPPKTEWLNMGFWKDTDVFPEACQALCNKLICAAQCRYGDRILDVGHGTGESLIVLLSLPADQRPSAVAGITSLPTHHHRSRTRVDRLLSSFPHSSPQVDLYLGDAVCQHSQVAHPLNPSSLTSFDRILALDCAYHFNTRFDFLRQGHSKLTPGGRIVLADICFEAKMLQSRRVWFLSSVFRLMPKHNIVSTEEYVAQMRDIGYVDVKLEDITEEVFPGFVRFLKSRGMGWGFFGSVVDWYSKAGARFVIVSGSRRKGFKVEAFASLPLTLTMVWPLTLRRTVLLKKTIHAPAETVLALLHDPNVLFSLSPFVAKVTPDPDSPNSFTFTEALSFAGIISYNATSKCLFEPLENGADCTVVAGFCTQLKVCYRVKGLQAEETEVSEDSIVESAFLTLPYVLKTFTFAHKSILEALAAKAEDRPDADQQ